MDDIIRFFEEAGRLKGLKRSGWVKSGIPDPESVADHSYRLALMSYVFSGRMGLDRDKCLRLAIFHDLGECMAGDMTPHDDISKKAKHDMEERAMQEMARLAGDSEIASLWEEYENGLTPESCLVKELDKLEMLFQASEYEREHKGSGIDLEEFWAYAQNRISNPLLVQIIDELRKRRP